MKGAWNLVDSQEIFVDPVEGFELLELKSRKPSAQVHPERLAVVYFPFTLFLLTEALSVIGQGPAALYHFRHLEVGKRNLSALPF